MAYDNLRKADTVETYYFDWKELPETSFSRVRHYIVKLARNTDGKPISVEIWEGYRDPVVIYKGDMEIVHFLVEQKILPKTWVNGKKEGS